MNSLKIFLYCSIWGLGHSNKIRSAFVINLDKLLHFDEKCTWENLFYSFRWIEQWERNISGSSNKYLNLYFILFFSFLTRCFRLKDRDVDQQKLKWTLFKLKKIRIVEELFWTIFLTDIKNVLCRTIKPRKALQGMYKFALLNTFPLPITPNINFIFLCNFQLIFW